MALQWLKEASPWRPVRILFVVALLLCGLMALFYIFKLPTFTINLLTFIAVVLTILGGIFVLRRAYWPAYLTALLYVACFPHADLGFLGFICLMPMLTAVMKIEGTKQAFKLAWVAGMLANTGKLYWLVYTISYFSPIPLPVATLILFLLTTTLGLFWGLNLATVHWLVKKKGLPLLLVFPVSWVFWDWFLTWFLGGFPWDLLGCAAFSVPLLNQTFDLVGEHGLGWLLAFGNVVFYQIWLFARKKEAFPKVATAALVGLVIAGMAYGLVRSGQIEKAMASGREVTVGMLQGNVDQSIKWKPQHREQILDNYADLAMDVAERGAELIIFPETAIARRQDRWRPLHPEISRYATDTKRYVLAGVPSKKKRKDRDDPRGPFMSLNSTVLISPDGDDLAWYDKNRLVPFGEYIPKKHWLVRLANLFGIEEIRGTLNFEASGIYQRMPLPGAPFSVFICYEAVYPSTVRKLANLGTKFLVTITNDAWFGNTSAPYQHWDQVSMRAIENRRYIARAANTGISGIIDPLGRTITASEVYKEASLTGTIRTLDITTIYARIGDVAAYLAAVIYCGLLIVFYLRQRFARKESK